jgi:hypothetical protein
MMATGASLVSSRRVPSLAARVLNSFTEARCEVSGVDVASGRGAAEIPTWYWDVRRSGLALGCSEFAPRFVQWIRQCDLDCPEQDGDQFCRR